MKKIKIIFLISIMLFAFFTEFDNVYAAGSVSLSSNKAKCTVDEEFIVNVNISGMSVATLTVKLNIDTSKVEYISGPQNSNFINGRVIYTWTDPSGGASPKTSGTIASFKFKAKTSGTAIFSVSGDFYDTNENVISPNFSGTNVVLEAKQAVSTGNNSDNNVGASTGTNSQQGTSLNTGAGNNNSSSGGDIGQGSTNNGVSNAGNIGNSSSNGNTGSNNKTGAISSSRKCR